MDSLGLRFVKYVNDPIWGEIPLTALELELINTTPFRRLQHIRQMGFAYLGFPTANHRRYEHCLGAMHVAHLLASIVLDATAHLDLPDKPKVAHAQAIRAAALLHDIGHAPYSHAFEEAVRKNPWMVEIADPSLLDDDPLQPLAPLAAGGRYQHELFTEYIIRSGPVAEILAQWDEREGGFPAHQIAALAVGRATYEGLRLFNPVIAGDFDADRIDYVCRDSYYCGFSQRFRLQELRRNITVRTDTDGGLRLTLLEDAIPAVSTLLWYRYRLMKSVHLDQANRTATQTLIKGLTEAFRGEFEAAGATAADHEKLRHLIRFHTEMIDADCDDYLKSQTQMAIVSNLIQGEVPGEVLSITPRHLQPEERLFLHFLLQEPQAIAALDRRLDQELGLDLFADVRLVKFPRFGTLVADVTDPERPPRSVFDRHFTPHGIMIDSLNTLAIYLYHPEPNEFRDRVEELDAPQGPAPFKYPLSPLRHWVYEAVKDTYTRLRKEWQLEGKAFALECWLSLLSAVEEEIQELTGRRPWLSGDASTQRFLRSITENPPGGMKIVPQPQWVTEVFSVEVFTDFEILQHHGLVDHIHIPVGGPGKDQPWMATRIDRRLSSFGRRFAERHLEGHWHYSELRRVVRERIASVSDEVKQLIGLQEALRGMDLFGEPRRTTYQEINQLRAAIEEAGLAALWVSE